MSQYIPKDNFSQRSEKYAQFRPSYPEELFNWLFSLSGIKENAWDCGTGNGQVAAHLALVYKMVYATDISDNQLKHAVQKDNIIYKKEAAEQTSFPDQYFDLITVAQAIHWFQFDKFYEQVYRVLKPDGIFAVIGYNIPSIDLKVDELLNYFYYDIVGPYWDKERKYIDEHLKTIPFPFDEINAPFFKMGFKWSFDQFIGYVQTWSAVQHYIKANGIDPVLKFSDDLLNAWLPGEIKNISFPVLLRVGKLRSNF